MAMGHKPSVRGGNGTGLTKPQQMLAAALGWETEVGVLTGKGCGSGYPTVYKLDVGNRDLKVGVEAEGTSHGMLSRQEQDRKKDALLSGLGWTVLRFRNDQILNNLPGVLNVIMSTISKSKKLTPMRNEMLASTSSGVETVSVLEKATLDRLARWLCQENDYHDRLESVCRRRAADPERDDRRYETEQKANGGYCDTCRDFAGELLAQFDLRESDEERRALADKELGPF